MTMTVKELMDKLEDFGDHLEVICRNDDDPEGTPDLEIRSVEGMTVSGELKVVIWEG